jgi:hypothetical protein
VGNEPREPVVYRQKVARVVSKVTAENIKIAISIVRERCLHEGRGSLPVYRVDVDFLDRIYVHCGPHYGVAEAPGALQFTLERKHGRWVITSVSQYTPNPERVIVT